MDGDQSRTHEPDTRSMAQPTVCEDFDSSCSRKEPMQAVCRIDFDEVQLRLSVSSVSFTKITLGLLLSECA